MWDAGIDVHWFRKPVGCGHDSDAPFGFNGHRLASYHTVAVKLPFQGQYDGNETRPPTCIASNESSVRWFRICCSVWFMMRTTADGDVACTSIISHEVLWLSLAFVVCPCGFSRLWKGRRQYPPSTQCTQWCVIMPFGLWTKCVCSMRGECGTLKPSCHQSTCMFDPIVNGQCRGYGWTWDLIEMSFTIEIYDNIKSATILSQLTCKKQ